MAATAAKVTAEDIEAAQDALAGGFAELVRLRESFLNGSDDVTWDQVKSQQGVIEYAEQALERLARQKRRYDESVRQGELGKIRAELDAHAVAEGEQFTGLLKAVEASVVAFASAYREHNEKVTDWLDRMVANGVPTLAGRVGAAPDAQGLSHSVSGSVRAGEREFSKVYSGRVLQELLIALRGRDGLSADYFVSDYTGHPTLAELYDQVGAPWQEHAPIPDDAVFVKAPNGAIFTHDAAHVPSAEEMKRGGLRVIDRAEALNG